MAGKWDEGTGDSYTRHFGPIRASIYREWDYKDDGPRGYTLFLSCGNAIMGQAFIPMSSLGVDWFDDKAGPRACKAAEKEVKRIVRSWLASKKTVSGS